MQPMVDTYVAVLAERRVSVIRHLMPNTVYQMTALFTKRYTIKLETMHCLETVWYAFAHVFGDITFSKAGL